MEHSRPIFTCEGISCYDATLKLGVRKDGWRVMSNTGRLIVPHLRSELRRLYVSRWERHKKTCGVLLSGRLGP